MTLLLYTTRHKSACVGLLLCLFFYHIQAQAIKNTIPNIYTPAWVEMYGYLGERFNINNEKRLLKIDSATLLSGFRSRPGSQVWIGEHVGKFLFSASLVIQQTKDGRLRQLTDEMVTKYISYQLPDGYLGTYLPKDYWMEWDVWAHKYAIIGLLSYYKINPDPKVLSTACKAGDLICKTFGPNQGQRDLMSSGHHVGMASGSILEPMVDLYTLTGDKKYLDFCKYILAAWEQSNGPKIVSNLEQYGTVTKVGNAKAYEMLSCFVGIMKYYKLTGEEKYLKLMQTAWQDIVLNRLFITGSTSDHEHFQENDYLPASNDDHIGEGCVTTTWIQFNYELFSISGDLKYYNEIEKSVYNHLLAAENPITACVSYYTALQGKKPHKCDQGYSCCLSSVPRGIALIPKFIGGTINNSVAVVNYEKARLATPLAELKLTSDFPKSGKVEIEIVSATGAAFDLKLNAPLWSKNYTATVEGKVYQGQEGAFVVINKKWKKGDKVLVNFDMPVQVLSGGVSYSDYVAYKRGPQILALDESFVKNKQLQIIECKENDLVELNPTLPKMPENWIGSHVFELKLANGDNVSLVPFADAGQWGHEVQVWLKANNMKYK